MRKYDSDESKYKCCFCIHVRAGTIVLGLWHLMLHVVVLSCLITSSLHPEMLRDDAADNTDGVIFLEKDTETTDNNAVLEIQFESPSNGLTLRKFKREDLCFAFALVMCTFLIALMMVYGAVRNRPGYLMPFFCLQVFDFCLTCLTVVGYITYAPNIKLWCKAQGLNQFPYAERLLLIEEKWLMLLLVIIFALIISLKAYLLDMVWSCYKFLQMRKATRSVVREYTVDPDSEMLLPPKYEEVVKMKEESVAPPPYTE